VKKETELTWEVATMASNALPSKILPGRIEKPSFESCGIPNWINVVTLCESRLLNNTSCIRDVMRRSTAIRMRYYTVYFINHFFILEAKQTLIPKNSAFMWFFYIILCDAINSFFGPILYSKRNPVHV
jgi:hypothetical protein